MNQPAFQRDNTWGSEVGDDAQAKILQAWRESSEGSGQFLKQLRELRGKSVNEMASELGLSVAQLNALEADNKDELPAPIYVKGYIKRYGLCLGIDESEFESVLEGVSKTVMPTLNRVSIKPNENKQHMVMRWVGYGAVIGVVMLIVFGISSMDLSGLWQNITASSSVVEESTPTELSLPAVIEKPVTTP